MTVQGELEEVWQSIQDSHCSSFCRGARDGRARGAEAPARRPRGPCGRSEAWCSHPEALWGWFIRFCRDVLLLQAMHAGEPRVAYPAIKPHLIHIVCAVNLQNRFECRELLYLTSIRRPSKTESVAFSKCVAPGPSPARVSRGARGHVVRELPERGDGLQLRGLHRGARLRLRGLRAREPGEAPRGVPQRGGARHEAHGGPALSGEDVEPLQGWQSSSSAADAPLGDRTTCKDIVVSIVARTS